MDYAGRVSDDSDNKTVLEDIRKHAIFRRRRS